MIYVVVKEIDTRGEIVEYHKKREDALNAVAFLQKKEEYCSEIANLYGNGGEPVIYHIQEVLEGILRDEIEMEEEYKPLLEKAREFRKNREIEEEEMARKKKEKELLSLQGQVRTFMERWYSMDPIENIEKAHLLYDVRPMFRAYLLNHIDDIQAFEFYRDIVNSEQYRLPEITPYNSAMLP